jgi:hypothetical protein
MFDRVSQMAEKMMTCASRDFWALGRGAMALPQRRAGLALPAVVQGETARTTNLAHAATTSPGVRTAGLPVAPRDSSYLTLVCA